MASNDESGRPVGTVGISKDIVSIGYEGGVGKGTLRLPPADELGDGTVEGSIDHLARHLLTYGVHLRVVEVREEARNRLLDSMRAGRLNANIDTRGRVILFPTVAGVVRVLGR